MTTLEKAVAVLESFDSDFDRKKLITAFEFNLHPSADKKRAAGAVAFFKDSVEIWCDGKKTLVIPMAGITEFRVRSGFGCVFAECTSDGADIVICRGDMYCMAVFSAVMKRMNTYLETGEFRYDYEENVKVLCPKCGCPFPPGTDVCPRCVSKGRYIKRIWEIAKPYRFLILLSVIMYFAVAAINLISPYLNRVLVDDYIKADTVPALGRFLIVIAMILGVNLLSEGLSVLRGLIDIEAGTKVIIKLRELVFNRIQALSLKRISKRTAGELMNRVTGDTSVLQNFITHEMGTLIEQILIMVSVSVVLFVYDWRLALLIIFPTPIVMFIHRLTWRCLMRRYNKQWMLNAKSNSILHDIFSGIRVIKSFGTEKYEHDRYDNVILEECRVSAKNETIYSIMSPIITLLMGIGEFFLLYYVGNKILNLEMTLGQMQQFSAYVSIIYSPLRWISNLPRTLVRVMTSVVKIFDIVDEKQDVSDCEGAKELDIIGNIDIEDISFGYDESVNVLKHITAHIKSGEMIGIVGKSGVGKSTLTNLIMRLYDVDSGSIKIDGTDIREISQDSLRSQIGVVLQETFLFSGSIYDNIAYAKPDATKEEIITASKLSGAHQFIMKLPDAYNTRVGEKGYTLSGGERQRISIARALLRDPRILILDEATASLDTETEKQIQDALQKLIKDRTTIAIAHRLSTLRNATRLIVLDKGTVAEIGTHDELMKKKGIYYGLVMAQRQMSKMNAG